MLRQDGSEYGVGVAQVLTGETGSSGPGFFVWFSTVSRL